MRPSSCLHLNCCLLHKEVSRPLHCVVRVLDRSSWRILLRVRKVRWHLIVNIVSVYRVERQIQSLAAGTAAAVPTTTQTSAAHSTTRLARCWRARRTACWSVSLTRRTLPANKLITCRTTGQRERQKTNAQDRHELPYHQSHPSDLEVSNLGTPQAAAIRAGHRSQFHLRNATCCSSYRPIRRQNAEKPAKSNQVPMYPDLSILHDPHGRYKVATNAGHRNRRKC